jgi:hypothetical protein
MKWMVEVSALQAVSISFHVGFDMASWHWLQKVRSASKSSGQEEAALLRVANGRQ